MDAPVVQEASKRFTERMETELADLTDAEQLSVGTELYISWGVYRAQHRAPMGVYRAQHRAPISPFKGLIGVNREFWQVSSKSLFRKPDYEQKTEGGNCFFRLRYKAL